MNLSLPIFPKICTLIRIILLIAITEYIDAGVVIKKVIRLGNECDNRNIVICTNKKRAACSARGNVIRLKNSRANDGVLIDINRCAVECGAAVGNCRVKRVTNFLSGSGTAEANRLWIHWSATV